MNGVGGGGQMRSAGLAAGTRVARGAHMCTVSSPRIGLVTLFSITWGRSVMCLHKMSAKCPWEVLISLSSEAVEPHELTQGPLHAKKK